MVVISTMNLAFILPSVFYSSIHVLKGLKYFDLILFFKIIVKGKTNSDQHSSDDCLLIHTRLIIKPI